MLLSTEPRDISVIQHNNLSRKDQQIKSRLFNGQTNEKPAQNPKPTTIPENANFNKAYQAPSNIQIDDFLKNMEDQFKKTNESSYNFL